MLLVRAALALALGSAAPAWGGELPGADARSATVQQAHAHAHGGGSAAMRNADAPGAAAAMQDFTASLEDEVVGRPRGRIEWSTHWSLCWKPYPGASGYELQVLTGEGASPRLREQPGPCFRLEVAKGRNAREQGLLNRSMLLASSAGQLAVRVRAVLRDERRTAWSAPFTAGETHPTPRRAGDP